MAAKFAKRMPLEKGDSFLRIGHLLVSMLGESFFFWGWNIHPQLKCGLFHIPWNKDPYETTSIMESEAFYFCVSFVSEGIDRKFLGNLG